MVSFIRTLAVRAALGLGTLTLAAGMRPLCLSQGDVRLLLLRGWDSWKQCRCPASTCLVLPCSLAKGRLLSLYGFLRIGECLDVLGRRMMLLGVLCSWFSLAAGLEAKDRRRVWKGRLSSSGTPCSEPWGEGRGSPATCAPLFLSYSSFRWLRSS